MNQANLLLNFQDAAPVRGRPLIIDSFAGGGGASTGIEMALGRSPDVAINHDAEALAMHEVNHPDTLHMQASVYAVDPREVTGRRPVGLMWFSPDCKHHSKAKGGRPVEKNIRDLAWVVVHYAELVSPDVIMLENVEEFQDWCPLTAENKPDLARKGETFREWVRKLRRLGYKVEWRELRACDFGAPTIRKRLFVIARRDGRPIVWPEPTHGAPDSAEVVAGTRKPWRTAAEIIDWSLPCPSIFETSAEIMEKHGLRAVRPLKDATLRRIARGVMRYVVEAAEPFLVSVAHGYSGGRREYPLGNPIGTQSAGGTQHGLVVPTLIQTGYGERPGQDPRVPGIEKPIGTMVAGGAKHGVVAAFLAQHNAGARMQNNAGRAATDPLSTLTTRGTQQQLVVAPLVSYGQHGGASRPADAPMHTITASTKDQNQVVAASMVNLRGTADAQLKGLPVDAPVPTVSAGGGHAGVVAAFLQKYYGAGTGQTPADPLHTLGTRDTFGLVTVEIDGDTYAIADIGMRMLTPREQFAAQGFPESYIIDRGPDGAPMTKTAQTRMCGNSVCPPLAAALARANCAHLAEVPS
jgi:DNA (cytosine-5)-methyltransferase 1